MARLFDDANNEYLEAAAAAATAAPLTISAWCYVDDDTRGNCGASLHDGNGEDAFYFYAHSDNKVRAYTKEGGGTYDYAATSTTFAADTWFHACAVYAAVDDRAAYLNGGGKGTSSDTVEPAGINTTTVGDLGSGFSMYSGRLAEVAIWNVALTDAEVSILADGYSPLLIRPESLVGYWPTIGRHSPEIDLVGGNDLTLNSGDSGPVAAAHPRIIYPSQSFIATPAVEEYDLVAAQGSYTFSGQATDVLAHRLLTAEDAIAGAW